MHLENLICEKTLQALNLTHSYSSEALTIEGKNLEITIYARTNEFFLVTVKSGVNLDKFGAYSIVDILTKNDDLTFFKSEFGVHSFKLISE